MDPRPSHSKGLGSEVLEYEIEVWYDPSIFHRRSYSTSSTKLDYDNPMLQLDGIEPDF